MVNPKALLTRFNLTGHEAEIYLASLELGKASVNDIAKKIGKSRTATYFHIDNLLKKGILKETRKGRLARFVAKAPEDMVADAVSWTEQLKEILPLLHSFQKKQDGSPIIEIHESKEGYAKILDTIMSLPAGSTYRLIEGPKASALELKMYTQERWTEYLTSTINNNIQSKALVTESTQMMTRGMFIKKNEELLRKRIWNMRIIPDAMLPFQDMLLICGHTTLFVFTQTHLVMSITHKSIAEMLSIIFDGLYMQGRPTTSAWM